MSSTEPSPNESGGEAVYVNRGVGNLAGRAAGLGVIWQVVELF